MPMGPPLLGSRSSYPCPQDSSPWAREAPGMDERTLPTHAELPVRADLPPGSSWGVWGDHDVLGTLNLLTPERVLAAARSIRTGRTFGLNLELTLPDPPLFRRAKFRHEVTNLGMTRMIVHDDLYHDWNTQSSSQWDGFRHVGHIEHGHYGGVPDEEHGVHHWAARGIVGRAVLADVDRWRDGPGPAPRAGHRRRDHGRRPVVVPRRPGHRGGDRRRAARAHRVPHLVPVARPRRTGRARGVAADAWADRASTCPARCGTCT